MGNQKAWDDNIVFTEQVFIKYLKGNTWRILEDEPHK